MNLYCIYLAYGDMHIATGIEELKKIINRLFNISYYQIIIVDNSKTDSNINLIDTNTIIIKGDNKNREFSGWDKGFDYLSEKIKPSLDDIVIIANDTFHRNYGKEYLKLFKKSKIIKTIKKNGLAGYYDEYPKAIELFDIKMKWWLRSSILIGSYKTFCDLIPLSLPFSFEKIFSDDINDFFNKEAQLSDRYKSYIKGWLLKNYDGCGKFNEAWHSQQTLNKYNFNSMKEKAASIISEHYLSGRAQKKKIYIYRINKKNIITKLILAIKKSIF